MSDSNVSLRIITKVNGALIDPETVEYTDCEGLPEGARCITGMVYTGCAYEKCFNESCNYLGLCEDPRHKKKDEKVKEDG